MIAALLPFALFLASSITPVDEPGFQKLVAAHKGKVVLYNFWATYCVPCRAEMPELLKLQAKLKPRGFELVFISADEPEQEADAAKVLQKLGAPAPFYMKHANKDEQFINAIEPKWSGALPALFIYDRAGRKVRSFIGETDMKVLEAAIVKTL